MFPVRRLLLCGFGVMLLVAALTATAQSTDVLTPGTIIQGQVTDETAGLSYTFDARAGEVAVVQMMPAAQDGLSSGEVRITDSSGTPLADSGAMMVMGRSGTLIGAEIIRDGTYTVTLYDDTGAFNLLLLLTPLLEPGATQSGTVAPPLDRDQPDYGAAYAASSTSPFTVEYTLTGGAYQPSLVAYRLAEGGNLFPIAAVFSADTSGELTNWRGGGIEIAGSRDLTIFLVGNLENMFGSPDPNATPASFEIDMGLEESND